MEPNRTKPLGNISRIRKRTPSDYNAWKLIVIQTGVEVVSDSGIRIRHVNQTALHAASSNNALIRKQVSASQQCEGTMRKVPSQSCASEVGCPTSTCFEDAACITQTHHSDALPGRGACLTARRRATVNTAVFGAARRYATPRGTQQHSATPETLPRDAGDTGDTAGDSGDTAAPPPRHM